MQLKDYYEILELPPSASSDEIKKAFRKLAHQYHPDKKNGDPYAVAQFATIKEAYEVLSNPAKKEYYLQQRWYAQIIAKKVKQETITPVSILKLLLELNKYVSRLDVHRMDKEGLHAYVSNILSNENIETLNTFNEVHINKSIVQTALKIIMLLPFSFVTILSEKLKRIKTDEKTVQTISEYARHAQNSDAWHKYKVWLLFLVVILLCLLIYFVSR